MAAPARQLSATPPFAGVRVCACGTILSQYNPDPDDLCALCRRREDDQPERSAEGIDLDRLVAGMLLVHSALHGSEPLNVGQQLDAMGIEADSWAVQAGVRHAERRHGLICRGVRGRPGYSVVAWETRYKQALSGFGVPMDRDPESGKWVAVASPLHGSERQSEVAAAQPPLFALSDADSDG